MEHVKNFAYSDNLDVIVKGKITGNIISTEDKVLYKIETDEFDKFEADPRCVYQDVTKPVVVKQFVADWYENNKDSFDYNLWKYLTYWEEQETSDFKDWITNNNNIFQILVNMHQFGYKVKNEKKYYVKLKGVSDNSCVLKYYDDTDRWTMGTDTHFNESRVYHTKEQLEEAGFEEVFNSPLFEVEEVE